MDDYPVPALATYAPNFLPLTSASSQILRVDRVGRLYVTSGELPATQKGSCTNKSTSGELEITNTTQNFILDSIIVPANRLLNIYGVHATSPVQSEVSIVTINGSSTIFELMGMVTENNPNWDPPLGGVPIEVFYSTPVTVQLRIKRLRKKSTNSFASGRIFAKLV
jgi:hypothetical protein